jgi:SAM-dependent methyltransferase
VAPRAKRQSSASAAGFVLNAGALEHYQDPTNYDRLYDARTEDRDFYVRRAASATSILEYGAGTGRLTLPLLLAGRFVTAVDISQSMLGRLTERADEHGDLVRSRLAVHCADMRTFVTRRRFDQIMVGFHALGHLYSHRDVATFLGKALSHLHPGGEILLDVPLPHLDLPGYDGTAQVLVSEMDGAAGSELLTLRLFQPQELLMHLHYAGFTAARLFGDFDGGKLESDSEVMVLSARRPEC